MKEARLKIVICGLSITSSWGNGHATTYRALVRELCGQGNDVLFLERDKPWYAGNRDLPEPPYGRTALYGSVEEFKDRFTREIAQADAVIVGSFVPDGIEIGRWVIRHARGIPVFYDIDTPVTLAKLEKGDAEYLAADLIPKYGLYLSFTGGPVLSVLERRYGSPKARPLYCSADLREYYPESAAPRWDLGYLGTYSDDRQRALSRLLIEPARRWPEGRFIVAGPQYPRDIAWGPNVERVEHLAPRDHREFYNGQRFTLNVTRRDMIEAGFSPSVRLFEAAACGTPIISDYWTGLDRFFAVGTEILVARDEEEVLGYLKNLPEERRREIGRRARERVIAQHSSARRAYELAFYLRETIDESTAARAGSKRTLWKLHENTVPPR